MLLSRTVVTCIWLAVLFVGGLPARAEAPVRIRVGWAAIPPELVPIIFAKPELARHLGVTYDYMPLRFAASPVMITALAAKEVDLAPLTYFSFAAAVQNAKMEDLRIIADAFQDGVDGYGSSGFFVRSDSGITGPKDLAGKVVATMGMGSAGDLGMRSMFLRAGMKPNRDFATIEGRPQNLVAMLMERKVDLIVGPIAISNDPRIEAGARQLSTVRDAMGKSQLGFFVARQAFIDAHRPALVDFCEDWLRATRWYTDPGNHDEAVQIAAAFLKDDPARLNWMFTRRDIYRDPSGQPDMAALGVTLGMLNEQGLLARPIDLAKLTDLSIIAEAARRLDGGKP